jgi:hypothetical protein
MIDFPADRSDAAEAAASTPNATVHPDASQVNQPQSAHASIPNEMALSTGAADWIEAVQRIEHRDWSAILRVASDGFDGIIRNIAHFVQTDGSMAAAADDMFQTASTTDHQASPIRAGSTGLAWSMPSNIDALFAGVQVQSRMAAFDLGVSGNPFHGVVVSADPTASARPEMTQAVHFATAAAIGTVAPVIEPQPRITSDVAVPDVDPVITAAPATNDDQAVVADVALPPELPAHSDLFSFRPGSGHVYVTDFDKGADHILVTSDRFSNFDEMLAQSVAYQDEGSTVIEFHNGTDFLVLTHFSVSQLSADMFTFEVPATQGLQSIHGTEGNDVIELGSGGGIVDPGAGFDVITAGSGHDTFVFDTNSGHDFIVDFKPQDDHIQIDTTLAKSFDDLLDHAAIYQDGGSAQIEFSGGQLITLYNTSAASIGADWFVFA